MNDRTEMATETAVLSMLHEAPQANSATRLFRQHPVLTWTLKCAYVWPLFDGLMPDVAASSSYIDEQAIVFEPEGFSQFIFGIPSSAVLKVSAGLQGLRWRGQLFVDNLTDEHAVTAISQPIPQFTISAPRIVGLRLSYEF